MEDVFYSDLTQISVFFRLSFFSGHSSFAMYCMLFLVVSTRALSFYTHTHTHSYSNLLTNGVVWCLQLYIQARLTSEWARLLRPTIQFFLIATAVYVGLSRVSDYKHHWSDVLAGLLLGAFVAIFTVSRTDLPWKENGKVKVCVIRSQGASNNIALMKSGHLTNAGCIYLAGLLRVQLLWAASRSSGVAGGTRNTHQFTRKSLQWNQLRQRGLSPEAWKQYRPGSRRTYRSIVCTLGSRLQSDSTINELFILFFSAEMTNDSDCTSRKYCYWMTKPAQQVTSQKGVFTLWACWRSLQTHVALVLMSGMNEIPFCLDYNASLWAGCRLTEWGRQPGRSFYIKQKQLAFFLP